jgi:hypothetical protein
LVLVLILRCGRTQKRIHQVLDFLVGRLFIIASISLCVVDCLGGQYPPGSALDGHKYLEIYAFLQDFPIYLNISSYSIPDDTLDFLGVCCYLPFLVFDFTNLCLAPPHFSQISQGLVILLIFFKEKLSVSLIFLCFFLVSISLIVALIFYYFSPLLILGLVCSCFPRSL